MSNNCTVAFRAFYCAKEDGCKYKEPNKSGNCKHRQGRSCFGIKAAKESFKEYTEKHMKRQIEVKK